MDQIMKNIDTELPIYILVRGRLPTRSHLEVLLGGGEDL